MCLQVTLKKKTISCNATKTSLLNMRAKIKKRAVIKSRDQEK